MKELRFLVIGKNEEILHTLKRVIEKNEGWFAETSNNEAFSYEYLDKHNVDILLLSAGLDQTFEHSVKAHIKEKGIPTKVIEHYGGGSGLLKNEVYQLFPALDL